MHIQACVWLEHLTHMGVGLSQHDKDLWFYVDFDT